MWCVGVGLSWSCVVCCCVCLCWCVFAFACYVCRVWFYVPVLCVAVVGVCADGVLCVLLWFGVCYV